MGEAGGVVGSLVVPAAGVLLKEHKIHRRGTTGRPDKIRNRLSKRKS